MTTVGSRPERGTCSRTAGPFDGIPDHLETPLTHWLHRQLIDPRRSFLPALRLGSEVKTSTLHKVTLAARIALPGHPDPMDDLKHLLRWGRSPDDFLHFMLQVTTSPKTTCALSIGASNAEARRSSVRSRPPAPCSFAR